MQRPSYMQAMYGYRRRQAHPQVYQPFFPSYTLPPIAKLAGRAEGSPPAFVPETTSPLMGVGQVLPELTDTAAKAYVDAAWPHLEPRVKAVADESADRATVHAAIMAGGVAFIVILASYWIKRG